MRTLWRSIRTWAWRLGVRLGRGGVRGRTKALGAAGERAAAKHLRREGYTILDRNVTLPSGEVDIVACAPDGRTIVLVEVKCRMVGDGRHPPPESQVHEHKRRKLRSLLKYLTAANGWQDRPRRIDVVAVDWGPRGPAAVRHFVDAVRGGPAGPAGAA